MYILNGDRKLTVDDAETVEVLIPFNFSLYEKGQSSDNEEN